MCRLTNIFCVFVGLVGLMAVRSEKMSWTLVYLLMCTMEFLRNIMLAPHIYERYSIPTLDFTLYEYFQVVVLLVQDSLLIVSAFA